MYRRHEHEIKRKYFKCALRGTNSRKNIHAKQKICYTKIRFRLFRLFLTGGGGGGQRNFKYRYAVNFTAQQKRPPALYGMLYLLPFHNLMPVSSKFFFSGKICSIQ